MFSALRVYAVSDRGKTLTIIVGALSMVPVATNAVCPRRAPIFVLADRSFTAVRSEYESSDRRSRLRSYGTICTVYPRYDNIPKSRYCVSLSLLLPDPFSDAVYSRACQFLHLYQCI